METTLTKEEIFSKVEYALTTIRPYLEADGGDVKLVEVTDDMVVKLEMLGNCGSCPMSSMTLKAGVEEAIKKEVPFIKSVFAVK